MREKDCDVAVIGAGCAGMAAAATISKAGLSCVVIDRDERPGGILNQCVHDGFGLHEFNEQLTGPEFAERLFNRLKELPAELLLGTTVQSIKTADDESGQQIFCTSQDGVTSLNTRATVLAMGCRERNRGNIRIPGTRPAGIYTAGLAQRLVNVEGYIPGKNVVIIGSGDIGLIMARRLSWIGCSVKAVVEILPYPSGLARNIVQCLHDFDIPLHLSCRTTMIYGENRVSGVEVTPIINGAPRPDNAFKIECDTVLLSVGLVPENELSKEAGIIMDTATGGPLVDANLMTSETGVFACGNVLHVHDLADWAVSEAKIAGQRAIAYLSGERSLTQFRIKAGSNVRYITPSRLDPLQTNQVYLRSLIVKNDAILEFSSDHRVIKSIKLSHIQPSEMISASLTPKELAPLTRDSVITTNIV